MENRKPLLTIQAYQTPLAWTHLQWLEEWNLPKLVDLYHQETLHDYLTNQVEKAEDIMELEIKSGKSRDQALEIVTYNILAPLRDEEHPRWSKKLLKLIPEIECSLKIDYSDQGPSEQINEFGETNEGQETKTTVGTTRASLPKRKRIHSLKKHREAITNNFKRLAELQKKRELKLKELHEEMEREGIPLEERQARIQQVYHEMVEVPDFNPYNGDKLELWKLRNEELLKSKVDAVIAAKITSKGLTHLEAIRELQRELDEILKAEHEAEEKSARFPQVDSLQTVTCQTKTLLEIATEKLRSLQHYPPIKGHSILGQLMSEVLDEGDGEEVFRAADKLTRHSDQQAQEMLYLTDPEREQDAKRILEEAVTRDEIRHVMIVEILESAFRENQAPESQ